MLNVLILEDEIYTLRFLEKLISEHPLVGQTTGTSSGSEAITRAGTLNPHIAFLDIELAPQDVLDGIEVARCLQTICPEIKLIFVTGYSKYAVDSFTVHPYDYVLKPIKKSKIYDILGELAQTIPIAKPASSIPHRMVFKSEDELVFVDTEDILYFEKLGRKAFVHSLSGLHEVICSFNELELLLNSQFIRIHKSYIVNMEKVTHVKDVGNQSYEVHFHNYNGIALMSRIKFREHQHRFTPTL